MPGRRDGGGGLRLNPGKFDPNVNKTELKDIIYRWRVRSAVAVLILVLALARPTPTSVALGVAVSLLGLSIRAWAAGHIRKEKELAVTGPYRYTRNPLYLGSFILGLGLVLGSWSFWCLGGYLLYFVAFYPVVIIEERDRMRRLFSEAYAVYEHRVPIFWPFRPGAAATDDRTWDKDLFRKNREIRAWIGTALVWVLVVLRGAL
jgi:protein-S-isoprenylcysteine O-methyltransferase Ste14